MSAFQKLALSSFITLGMSAVALAEDIRLISIGQFYYRTGIAADELVRVTAVDRERARVQIAREAGEPAWVPPGELITKEESLEKDIRRGLLAGGFIDHVTADSPIPSNAFNLCNDAASDIRVAVAHDTPKGWITRGWFTVGKGSCGQVTGIVGTRVLWMAISAENFEWRGSVNSCVHPTEPFAVAYKSTCTEPLMAVGLREMQLDTNRTLGIK